MNRPYVTGDAAVDEAIAALVAVLEPHGHSQLMSEILTTAAKLASDEADRGDLKIINSTLKEMRYAFRVFRKYRGVRKVSIFGSARTPVDAPEYQQGVRLSKRLADLGYMIITGAGPGIMRAGHEGAGVERSFGVNIRLPFEQSANDIIRSSPLLINFKYFFTRKLAFIKEADAVVLLAGGFGTHDEGFESLTLVQTGKSRMMPIIFLDAPGATFWRTFDRYVRDQLLGPRLIGPEDLSLYKVTDSMEEAVQEIVTFYSRFHSTRFVSDKLIVRLVPPVPSGLPAALNREFADIVTAPMVLSPPLPQEADEPLLSHLPRLVVPFDRRQYGRLRQMIDRINSFPP